MKKVLGGNEAFARGAYEAGVRVVSSYPGTPSTEITEYASKYEDIYVEWATNEKVGMEVVIGASVAGARALTCMKHVGLNVAADPLMTVAYTGVNGGLVILVADDPNMYSSQNEQDSRHYARFSKLPMLEPSDGQEALDMMKTAFDLSEKFACPVFVRSVTRISHSAFVVETGERTEHDPMEYKKDVAKWVMTPANARNRHFVVEERLLALAEESNHFAQEHIVHGSDIGIISSGVPSQYVKEAMPEASVLKLGMIWPLPMAKIKAFAGKVKKLYVVEELDNIIETELKAAGLDIQPLKRSFCGELSVEAVSALFGKKLDIPPAAEESLPMRPPNMCAGCSHRGMFYAMSRMKLTILGDIGCYTLALMPPLNAMDTCVCMGASVSMAHGFDKGSNGKLAKNSVAVIGDSTFLHTGVNGLINTVYNQGVSTVVIVDNRTTGMTGHQPNPASGFDIKGNPVPVLDLKKLCEAIGVKHVRMVDPFDIEACTAVLKEEMAREETSVIITNKPCVFVDKGMVKTPYEVNEANCNGCKICLRLGCPAVSWNEEKKIAHVNPDYCAGCGLCVKLCKFNAISQVSL